MQYWYGSEFKANKRVLEEDKTMQHFKETAKRDEAGRFILRLNFKPEVHELRHKKWPGQNF